MLGAPSPPQRRWRTENTEMTSAASTMEDATAACDAALSELEEAASSLLSAASEIIAQPPPPPPPLGLEKGPLTHFSLITC